MVEVARPKNFAVSAIAPSDSGTIPHFHPHVHSNLGFSANSLLTVLCANRTTYMRPRFQCHTRYRAKGVLKADLLTRFPLFQAENSPLEASGPSPLQIGRASCRERG